MSRIVTKIILRIEKTLLCLHMTRTHDNGSKTRGLRPCLWNDNSGNFSSLKNKLYICVYVMHYVMNCMVHVIHCIIVIYIIYRTDFMRKKDEKAFLKKRSCF